MEIDKTLENAIIQKERKNMLDFLKNLEQDLQEAEKGKQAPTDKQKPKQA